MSATLHRQLCEAAQAWLMRPASRGGPGCRVAFSEVQTHDVVEVADAIGFRTASAEAHSILIEVKVSRADFLADRKKPHRSGERLGLGTFRYYFAPAGLISVDELPDRWGLIEIGSRPRYRVLTGHLLLETDWTIPFAERWGQVCSHWAHKPDSVREVGLLTQLLARVGDPAKVNDMLKEANAARTRLAREVDALREQNRKLNTKVLQLWVERKHPERVTHPLTKEELAAAVPAAATLEDLD